MANALNRHSRRQQAKLGRSGRTDGRQIWWSGLEAQARNCGFPSVQTMVEAHFTAAKAIVDRLPVDPTLSLGDCYMICAAAFATATGGPMHKFAAQFIVMLEPFLRKKAPRGPNEHEAAAILAMVRTYLDAVALRGAWSLEGVGELRLNDRGNDVDMSAATLMPGVAVPEDRTCWLCKKPFAEGEMVAVVPYDGAPPGWTSVQIHASCEPLLGRNVSGDLS